MAFLLKHQVFSFLLFCLLIIFSNTTSAATIYVDVNVAGGGLVDGSSWANAFTDLQPALTAAVAGDQIWVADGTYRPTVEFDADASGGGDVREVTFYLNTDGVEVYGGFVAGETSLAARNIATNHPTILSGEIGAAGNADNAYHVLYIDGTTASGSITTATIIDGFQVTAGNADGANLNGLGGGIYNNGQLAGRNCSPRITNCDLSQNTTLIGGAMYNAGGESGNSSPVITNCRFSQNTVTAGHGGAIQNNGFNNGTSSPVITNCSFSQNTAPAGNGGAIYNSANSSVLPQTSLSSPTITNCSFSQNTANSAGAMASFAVGGVSNPTISNSIFWGAGSGSDLIRAINSATGNMSFNIYDDGTIDGTFTVPTGMADGGNNIEQDPLFTNAVTGDLSLQTGSSAIDVGNDAVTVPATDLVGNTRRDNTIDLGALEGVSPATTIYVDLTAGGLNNGGSWINAYTNLQDALNVAVAGDQIWVADGTYLPTVEFDADASGGVDAREATFYLNTNGVEVYGGFAGGEATLGARNVATNPTILSGDLGAAGNTDNAYHVFYIDGTSTTITTSTIIDGFQITGGNAGGGGINERGGGLINDGRNGGNISSPTIRNCSFSQNTATYGGAIYNYGNNGGTSSPNLTNCSFSQNMATNSGGAIDNDGSSGGTSTPNITNCSFSQNTAVGSGGAILNEGVGGTSNPTITNSIFWGAGSGSDLIFNSINATGTMSFSIYDDGTINSTPNLPTGMINGGSNLEIDPLFTNAAAGDLSLQTGSPAIDVGNDGANSTTTDLVGNTRRDNTIDLGALESVSPATTIYVDWTAVGLNNGGSWTNAYTNLQDALNVAVAGDQIWIADGTYLPTVAFDADGGGGSTQRFQTFYLDADGVEVYGGFAGGETTLGARDPNTNLTILSGDFNGDDSTSGTAGTTTFALTNTSENAYHVFLIDGTTSGGSITTATIVDGLQIRGGNGDAGGASLNNRGGGIFNHGVGAGITCNPSITNCIFSQNTAGNGGAMINYARPSGTSSPSVTNCTFLQNTATFGGAMVNYGYLSTSNPTITNCIFSQNIAGTNGGALLNDGFTGTSNPSIINCSFSQNAAGQSAGAIFNYGDSGISSPSITNCSFSQNTAVNGGALLNNGVNGGTSNPTITNSIFWGAGSGSDLISNNSGTGSITYSIYEQGVTTIVGMTDGGNNLAIDPLFTNAATGDLSLQLGSPAIDAGNDALNSTTTDLANNPRKDGVIDMGAFEFVSVVMPP
ncbi:MAG: beta strand repeat-containing protein, partial [Chitinophagales bacterium]